MKREFKTEDFYKAGWAACDKANVTCIAVMQGVFGKKSSDKCTFTVVWVNKIGYTLSHAWNVKGYTPIDFETWVYKRAITNADTLV